MADFLKTIPGPVIFMLGCLDRLPGPHRSVLDVAFGLCSGSALVLETGVLTRDFADANTPVPGGGFRRGQSARAPGHRVHPPAEEHNMAARLTDVTVTVERSEAFREVAWDSVNDVALLSSLPS